MRRWSRRCQNCFPCNAFVQQHSPGLSHEVRTTKTLPLWSLLLQARAVTPITALHLDSPEHKSQILSVGPSMIPPREHAAMECRQECPDRLPRLCRRIGPVTTVRGTCTCKNSAQCSLLRMPSTATHLCAAWLQSHMSTSQRPVQTALPAPI